jgi:beta-N-acetylhexosaminidase
MFKKLPQVCTFSLLALCLQIQANAPFIDSQSAWAQQLLQRMTLREKIGQLFMVAVTSNFTNEGESLASTHGTLFYNMEKTYITQLIKEYHVGGLIVLRKNDPKRFVDLLNDYQSMSALPLLVGLDAEWGLSLRLRNMPRFPRALTLGAIQDTSLIEQLGVLVGQQCRAAGVHWNFAPDVDVNNNFQNPVIHDRSFGDDPQRVARLGILYMQGLRAGGVLTCAKHFPGHGDTAVDSHCALPIIAHTREHLDAVELYPFTKLIEAGVDGVMGAHLSVPTLGVMQGQAASLSKNVMTDLLQDTLKFSGLIVTDALGMSAIMDHYLPGEAELQAVLAGNDMILCPTDVPAALTRIEEAVRTGRISEVELDRRVLKILKAKAWVGLDHYQPASYDELVRVCDTPQVNSLKQQLYAQAITAVNGAEKLLLTGESGFVNSSHKTALVCCGAQDTLLAHALGTRVSDVITPSVTHVVIAIFGMNKWADQNFGVSSGAQKLVTDLCAKGKHVLLVLFGSPYSVMLFPKTVPIVVAYEDDPDAQKAVAETLLGQRQVAGQLPIRFDPNCFVTPAAR